MMTFLSAVMFGFVLLGYIIRTFQTKPLEDKYLPPFSDEKRTLRTAMWLLLLLCYVHLVFLK